MDISVFMWPLAIPVIIFFALFGIFIFIKSMSDKEAEEVLPYRLKKYFFSRSEKEFNRILVSKINHAKFSVFPKVRLADFIEVAEKGEEYQAAFNRIKSKHIDFLIYDIQQDQIVLAIELDGKSHLSEKAQERDVLVEKIYKTIGVRLARVKVGESFEEEVALLVDLLATFVEQKSSNIIPQG